MSKVISYHTFIFPFSIEEKDIEKKLEKYNWKKEIFEKEGILDGEIPNYNEYMYFYENVRKVLYGNSQNDKTSIYYEYSNNDLGYYIIKKSDENDGIYKLKIKKVHKGRMPSKLCLLGIIMKKLFESIVILCLVLLSYIVSI